MSKHVIDIVMDYLKEHGYDGLYEPNSNCRCEISDELPCGEYCALCCKPGYKVPCDCDDKHDYHIVETNPNLQSPFTQQVIKIIENSPSKDPSNLITRIGEELAEDRKFTPEETNIIYDLVRKHQEE